MGQPQTVQQPKDRRIKNFTEVSLGYPKAVSITEARRCPQCAQPTCMNGCPLGIDIPGFIRLLREGDATGALNRIREQNVLPGVCGRICLAPCENACVFNNEDAAIGIRALERYAADNGRARPVSKASLAPKNGRKVAIVGSGPSGLAAAAELARKGYAVTVFEALPKAGGILRYGIPEFRLPARVLDAELADIAALGVDIQTNVIAGQTLAFDELTSKYDAVFLTIGAGSPDRRPIQGDHLAGVYYVQEVLMRFNLWEAQNYPKSSIPALLGNVVAVIGSGPAAVDCARMAVRLGKKASVVFSGLEEEVKLYPADRKNAVEEGVKFESLVNPLEIIPDEERGVKGLKCERLDFVENPGAQWELKPVPESDFVFEADTIVLASDPVPGHAIKRYLPELKWTDEGNIWVDPQTGMTSIEKIFAAGDAVTGAGTLVDAMVNGKRTASAIDQYLNAQTPSEVKS